MLLARLRASVSRRVRPEVPPRVEHSLSEFGAGFLALRLSRYLQLPILNQSGIAGSYDYYLRPVDPENHTPVASVLGVLDRLGLKIKRGRGPIQTLVIDHVEQLSDN